MANPKDPDGDSQMHSGSSSDDADSEAMFPAELDPPGLTSSQNNGVTPPQSQDVNNVMDTTTQRNTPDQVDYGFGTRRGAGVASWTPQSDFGHSAAAEQEEASHPWWNRKAQEEYYRALSQVQDRDFSLEQFGDPFDLRTEKPGGNDKDVSDLGTQKAEENGKKS
ncbi:hypothetical protein ACLMJK_003991 [Lecanora helva]